MDILRNLRHILKAKYLFISRSLHAYTQLYLFYHINFLFRCNILCSLKNLKKMSLTLLEAE